MDRGEIYLGPFLYSDLAGSKRRPVCVVSAPNYNAGPDVMVAMISSGARVTSPRIGDVVLSDWQQAGLLPPSVVRAGRLQVIERRLLSAQHGALSTNDLAAVDQALKGIPRTVVSDEPRTDVEETLEILISEETERGAAGRRGCGGSGRCRARGRQRPPAPGRLKSRTSWP